MKILTKKHWRVFFGMICTSVIPDVQNTIFRFDQLFFSFFLFFFRYAYQLSGKGKWSSMTLKKPKVKGTKSKGAKKKQKDKDAKWKEQNSGGEEDDESEDEVCSFLFIVLGTCPTLKSHIQPPAAPETSKATTLDGPNFTDPLLTTPLPRYNAMLAVLRSTLYM